MKMQSISIELFIYLVDRLQILNIYTMKLIINVKYELDTHSFLNYFIFILILFLFNAPHHRFI